MAPGALLLRWRLPPAADYKTHESKVPSPLPRQPSLGVMLTVLPDALRSPRPLVPNQPLWRPYRKRPPHPAAGAPHAPAGCAPAGCATAEFALPAAGPPTRQSAAAGRKRGPPTGSGHGGAAVVFPAGPSLSHWSGRAAAPGPALPCGAQRVGTAAVSGWWCCGRLLGQAAVAPSERGLTHCTVASKSRLYWFWSEGVFPRGTV